MQRATRRRQSTWKRRNRSSLVRIRRLWARAHVTLVSSRFTLAWIFVRASEPNRPTIVRVQKRQNERWLQRQRGSVVALDWKTWAILASWIACFSHCTTYSSSQHISVVYLRLISQSRDPIIRAASKRISTKFSSSKSCEKWVFCYFLNFIKLKRSRALILYNFQVLLDLNCGADQNKTSISPECLFLVIWKVVPTFKGYHQHDAHEFLRYMLDRLHTELLNVTGSLPQQPTNSKMKNFICQSPTKTGSSFVSKIFEGTLLSEVRCLVCGADSKKHDPFLDLSLDIPEKYYRSEVGEDGEKKAPPVCDISDCLSSFISVEELTEAEFYHCNQCKKKQRSTKRFWIRRLPNVLCLHIKRFRWNQYYRWEVFFVKIVALF